MQLSEDDYSISSDLIERVLTSNPNTGNAIQDLEDLVVTSDVDEIDDAELCDAVEFTPTVVQQIEPEIQSFQITTQELQQANLDPEPSSIDVSQLQDCMTPGFKTQRQNRSASVESIEDIEEKMDENLKPHEMI